MPPPPPLLLLGPPYLITDGAHAHADQVGKESGLVAVDQLLREEAEQAGGLEHTVSGGGGGI